MKSGALMILRFTTKDHRNLDRKHPQQVCMYFVELESECYMRGDQGLRQRVKASVLRLFYLVSEIPRQVGKITYNFCDGYAVGKGAC
jgi:hypothetical protein